MRGIIQIRGPWTPNFSKRVLAFRRLLRHPMHLTAVGGSGGAPSSQACLNLCCGSTFRSSLQYRGAHAWSNRLVPRESAVALRQRSEGRHKARIDGARPRPFVPTACPCRDALARDLRRISPNVGPRRLWSGWTMRGVSMAMNSARASSTLINVADPKVILRAVFSLPLVREAAVPRRTDAHAETGMPRVHRGVYTVIRYSRIAHCGFRFI